jgi:hypothetical protein
MTVRTTIDNIEGTYFIQSAIDNYEERMFEYASEAQQQTATNEQQLFS